MKVFDKYAEYYDLIYQDKDYHSEAYFIHQIIQQHLPTAKTIFDLGCGTGNHAFPLCDLGYQITGIDNSKVNIESARNKVSLNRKNNARLEFRRADIRDIRLKRTFDVVISLFHVMSYQITNEDIKAAFQTAKNHLCNRGLFIFDCWYGPAVLTDRPTMRMKKVENQKIKVRRVAKPSLIPSKNLVEINYEMTVLEKTTLQKSKFSEKHRMRYLFQPEIEYFLREVGLKLISCREWMTNNPPGFDTWNVYFINNNMS
jgi:SAM-dependent methyltransferase